MSETTRVVIPFESLDPLTIGASDDESKKSTGRPSSSRSRRRTCSAAIYPDEPEPVANATEAARAASSEPVDGPRFSELLGGAARGLRDRQPVPPHPGIEAAAAGAGRDRGGRHRGARVICANGKVFPMSESDIEQKLGRENLDRMERLGIGFFQNEPRDAERYRYVGVSSRGTPVWLHEEVARGEVKISIGQAQANHWGAGGGAS